MKIVMTRLGARRTGKNSLFQLLHSVNLATDRTAEGLSWAQRLQSNLLNLSNINENQFFTFNEFCKQRDLIRN